MFLSICKKIGDPTFGITLVVGSSVLLYLIDDARSNKNQVHRNYFSDRIQMIMVVITLILHISSDLNTYNIELIKEDMTAS